MMRAPLILGAALLLLALLRRRAAAVSLVALERPGGGRIQDKRDPAPADVELVDGVPVHRAAAAAWRAMRAAYQADTGDAVRLRILSGYRSSARQAELFRRAVERYGSEAAARRWVAPPGSSAHQSGRALDLDIDGGSLSSARVNAMRATATWRWLEQHARAFGFYPYSAEPWHWEFNPPASPQAAPVGD